MPFFRLPVAGLLYGALLVACSRSAAGPSLPPTLQAVTALQSNAAGFKVLYAFKNLPDGAGPAAAMVALNGVLYGTTQVGGKGGAGSVFSSSTTGHERVLYSFGGKNPDGVFPVAPLLLVSGTFYGATSSGGANGFGGVFKIGKTGNEQLIYSFKGGNDGADPYTGLVLDKGTLYGTTISGGGSTNCNLGCGTVFAVTPSGKEHVVYAFKGNKDGIGPLGAPIVVNGQLYGTTPDGGKNGSGTIYKTSVNGSEQVLHSFGSGNDGSEPEAGLVAVGGKLYGTTNTGGSHFNGTIFSATTGGAETVIYNFKGGSDGANPEANVLEYKSKLYGTTSGGGSSNDGTVFVAGTSGSESVVHAFTSGQGSDPRAALVAIGSALYGTTSLGGTGGVGTIFRISP